MDWIGIILSLIGIILFLMLSMIIAPIVMAQVGKPDDRDRISDATDEFVRAVYSLVEPLYFWRSRTPPRE